MKRFFITGTDTDCGKTYVASKLLLHVPNSAAIKPIASGCDEVNGQLINSDALILQQHYNAPLEQINPWRFKSPVSPHIAASRDGARISVAEIAAYCTELKLPGIDTLFIEGAGGLMVPLNEQETWIDFLLSTKIPVILVVGMKLGCLNHALLSAAMLQSQAIQCSGWIANCLDPSMNALEENITTLCKKLPMPLLTRIEFSGDIRTCHEIEF